MTKAEIIAAMKGYPDNADVKIWLNMEGYDDQGAVVDIKNVSCSDDEEVIYIEPEGE